MPYTRVKLIDPSGVLPTYEWDVNYNSEDGFGERRDLTIISNSSGTGFVVQQGDKQPMAISVSGKFTTRAQHSKFIAFFNRSAAQTIYFEDFEGHLYEVMMTAYLPKRVRASGNKRGAPGGASLHYYEYTMEMTVLRVISGDWVGA